MVNGGELIALVRTENTQKEEIKQWLQSHNAIIHGFEVKDWQASKNNKFSEIKRINLSIIVLYHQKWSNKCLRSCDRNSDFFRDLILMDVSESIGSLLDQFVSSFDRAYVLSIFGFDAD